MSGGVPPTLYYFNFGGRAEAARWCFKIGGVEFNDFRFPKGSWQTEWKSKSPTGQCPWLEVNGKTYNQSLAIMLFAAKKADLVPEDPEKLMAVTMHLQNFEEAMALKYAILKASNDTEREFIAQKNLPEFEKKLLYAEMKVGETRGKYAVGDQLTVADVGIAVSMRNLMNPKATTYAPNIVNQMPLCADIAAKLASHPKIEEYLKENHEN